MYDVKTFWRRGCATFIQGVMSIPESRVRKKINFASPMYLIIPEVLDRKCLNKGLTLF